LIKFDTTQLTAQLQQAESDVAAAQAYLNSVASVAINPIAIAAAQQAYQVANNHYHALTAQTNSMTLRDGNLISPVNGVVITVLVNPGENFGANDILMTLMDQSSVLIHTQLPLANLQQIHLNALAQIVPSALPDVHLTGKVTAIIPQADPQTDTFQVDVSVTNTQQALLPGMSAFVQVQSQQTALVIPRIAVLNPDTESSVFKVLNGHAYMQQVHVVGSDPNVFYIDSGLSPNDQIVVLPLNRLHQGQAITINSVEH
jgi:RND family efflux transporter MFP subunit